MKKKNQSFQSDADFDSFDPVSSSVADSGFNDRSAASPSGNDFDFPAASDQESGGSFRDGDDFTPPPVQRRRSGSRGPLIAVMAAVLVLALGAAAFLLIPKDAKQGPRAGAAAPTGKTAFRRPGCELLLNELLVTGDSGLSQKQLEVELAKLDGAVVGYLPVLNQYQVRFNTETKKALDKKKTALESSAGVVRVDYNYLLSVSASAEEVQLPDFPALQENALGLLGGLPPEGASGYFLLTPASAGSIPAEELPEWLSGRRGSIPAAYRADQSAALLNQNESGLFASCFFYETNQDGTLSGYTTTCALRYQLFCLVNAGADTVAFPLTGPRLSGKENPAAESELNELYFAALEKEHPSFMVVKAWNEEDFLISMFTGSETGKRHLITVSPFTREPVSVLDAAGAGRAVYLSGAETGGADLAACGSGSETAVMLTAAQLASIRAGGPETDLSGLKSTLMASCGVLVAQEDGTVIPGFDPTVFGSFSAGSYRLLELTARDSRTGRDIPKVTYTVTAGADSVKKTSKSGRQAFLLPDGPFSVTAKADQYKKAVTDRFPAQGREAVINLTGAQAAGFISGKITLSGSGVLDSLTIRLRDTATGAELPEMPLSPEYRKEVNPGEYDLIISGRNRTAVTVYGVSVTEGAETVVPTITLSIPSDLSGTASGMIKDAMTGGALEGVDITVFEGVNAPETDHPVVTAVSDSRGRYKADLPGGVYTVYLKKSGYRSETMLITAEGEKTIGDQDCIITPTVPEGSVRIVLEWGPQPTDLDSHLVSQSQDIHMYYPYKLSNGDAWNQLPEKSKTVTLDVDGLGEMAADKSNRVETTTIHTQLPGKYTFYIHDFSNQSSTDSHSMAESGATVKVYIGDDILTFDVPDEKGTLWEVFTLENGIITPSGTVTYHVDAATVGQ